MSVRREVQTIKCASGKFPSGVGYVQGAIVPIEEARIPLLDWGFLHSDATYDVVHVWDGYFFRLDDHLDRFFRGMSKLNMELNLDHSEIKEILKKCVQATGLKNAYVEMICTRGVPRPGSRDPRHCINQFYAFVVPFMWVATMEQQEKGVRAHISQVQRIPPESIDPTIKNFHWLDLTKAQFEAFTHGAEISILTDSDSYITEGHGFNVFVIKDRVASTPEYGVLKGITRLTALELAKKMGLGVEERRVHSNELINADEIFITSTAGGIMPVKIINEKIIGTGKTPLADKLRESYWQAHYDSNYIEAAY